MVKYEILANKDHLLECHARSGWFWAKKDKEAVIYTNARAYISEHEMYHVDILVRDSHCDDHVRKCKCFAALFIRNMSKKFLDEHGFAIITPNYVIADFSALNYSSIITRAGHCTRDFDWTSYTRVAKKTTSNKKISIVMSGFVNPYTVPEGFDIVVHSSHTSNHRYSVKINDHEVPSIKYFTVKPKTKTEAAHIKRYLATKCVPSSMIRSKKTIEQINNLIKDVEKLHKRYRHKRVENS